MLLWQRQFLTSHLSLGFWVCLLGMYLGEAHYYGLLLSEVTVQALKKGMGDMPWAENS